MQTTLLPVDKIFQLSDLTDGKVRHLHGCYNMGFGPMSRASTLGLHANYFGVFRNCTRNSRGLLGRPAMAEGEYSNILYAAEFTHDFKLSSLYEIRTDRVIHDVRVSGLGMIGCERIGESTFYPVVLDWSQSRLKAGQFHNVGFRRVHDKHAKNINFLPDGWLDMGWIDHAGLARMKGCIPQIVEDKGQELRGSAPFFRIGSRLITTYHRFVMEGTRRNYFHFFAELEPTAPFKVIRHSCPFKLGRGGEPSRIQFLMACFPMPGDASRLVVSFGEADADNTVGTINASDVLGLLL